MIQRTDSNLYMGQKVYSILDVGTFRNIAKMFPMDNYLVVSNDFNKELAEILYNKKLNDTEYTKIYKDRQDEFDKILASLEYATISILYAYRIDDEKELTFRDASVVFPFLRTYKGLQNVVDKAEFRKSLLDLSEKFNQSFILSKLPSQTAKCVSPSDDLVIDLQTEDFIDSLSAYFNQVKRYEFFYNIEDEHHVDFEGIYFNITGVNMEELQFKEQ